ncbi:Uma2 family endonuclease [Streptomyces sp. NPDC059009]|uniref:Uma2 family endonuclease n=1 Tax=Streptomyces sp. NPDC059009 TaxID=3346694 RepID=UPI0036C4EE47
MADRNTRMLDALFNAFEGQPVLEGMRTEVVEGNVHMTPQRDTHWHVTWDIVRQLPRHSQRVFSNVRIDYPGHLNGLCSDVALLTESAQSDDEDRWSYQDVRFVAEVITRGTAAIDHGPKKTAYATAGVAVYLIADPYQGTCHIHTPPKDGAYTHTWPTVAFGEEVDLTDTPLGLALKTDTFPRD